MTARQRCSGSAVSSCEAALVAVCAPCGRREIRPARPGDAPEWRRACPGWVTSGDKEFCSPACRDGAAAGARKLVVALLALGAAAGVDLAPPPPARRRGR